jgi:hypothetical protein
LEIVSIACAVGAVLSAARGIDVMSPHHPVHLGAGLLVAAFAVGAMTVAPFRAWRRGAFGSWPHTLSTGYWAIAVVTAAVGEALTLRDHTAAAVAVWAISAAIVATLARQVAERRLWIAGAAWVLAATAWCLARVTVPSRLVWASAHPGTNLWTLAVCVAAVAAISFQAPAGAGRARAAGLFLASALAVFGVSLGILEAAERISQASVRTDFQRGQTGVSIFWGILALAIFVTGLAGRHRGIQRIGLGLFALVLVKLFLYDIPNLNLPTRALSFMVVGAILLAASFFSERYADRGDRGPPD